MAHALSPEPSGQLEEASSDSRLSDEDGSKQYVGVAVGVGDLDNASGLQQNRASNLPGEDNGQKRSI